MARSIQEMLEKFKQLLADDGLFYGLTIILVGLSAFGLGRWSMGEGGQASSQMASIVMTERALEEAEALPQEGGEVENVREEERTASNYVASKKGTKYHLLWCPGASQIKEENKIYFDSKEEAERAGYEPATNCKGI